MPPGLRDRTLLDGKECWKLWNVELGTLNAVRRKFREDGLINPKTGEPPTASGIEKAAFYWAIENKTEARKDLERAWLKEGLILTESEWERVLNNMAKLVFHQRPRRYERFVAA